MSIEKIQVLGEEIILPNEVDEDVIRNKETFLSLLRDLNESLAERLSRDGEFSIKIESNIAIAIRDTAVMG